MIRTTLSNLLSKLWRDQRGSVLSAELIMLVTLLALGITVGAKSFRDSAVTEMADYAQAIANFDQSYNIPDASTPSGLPGSGSGFVDARDYCDTSADVDGQADSTNPGSCLVVCIDAVDE